MPFSTALFIILFCAFLTGVGPFLGWWRGHQASVCLLWMALIIALTAFAMQWILSGRLPLANMFETLQFVVIALVFLSVTICRRNRLLLPLASLFGGALALVAHLVEVNPVVTPLMPVLHSPWLSLHVTLVMAAYALLALTFVISLTALLWRHQADALRNLNMTLLYPAVWFLGTGIFSGAVWANVSWGEYWSWDPKETWALITLLVYSLPLHSSLLRIGVRSFHIYLLFAILTVAMTYFGVNCLDSLHAYS